MLDSENPLLAEWCGPYGLPPFGAIAVAHYRPALQRALTDHCAEIDCISQNPAAPDFENTIATLERSGRLLQKVAAVFWNHCRTDSTPELEEIEREMSGMLARHANETLTNVPLFARIDALHARIETLGITNEQSRVLELTHNDFVRAGARLEGGQHPRMTAIVERLAQLGAAFSQNVLADEASFLLLLEENDLDGLSGSFRASAAVLAAERGASGKYGVSLSRSSIEAFLQSSSRRDLRETAFNAWARRGEKDGATDNRPIIAEILRLRYDAALLLGYENFAAYKLDNTMAKTPEAVRALLDSVWASALTQAEKERTALRASIKKEGGDFRLGPADWRYYAERVRKERYDLDQAEIAPYFQLENMIGAAFYVAERLFGLRFVERHGLELYHPEVRAFDVLNEKGEHIALFLGDYFARPSKRGGAWMSEFRVQEKLVGDIRPIVVNVLNFMRGAARAPTLLSLDDARTLFHEFGHALHGMLSNVTYPRVAGTDVVRDFVELPSQLYERWLLEPSVLRRFALKAQTDEALPEEMLARILASRNFNQGFTTVEFCASAFVDLDVHERNQEGEIDVGALELASLMRINMPEDIIMCHRLPHFSHIFSSETYASCYYSYLWAEVLAADAFDAFEETGDLFSQGVAGQLYEHIYAAGGSEDERNAFIAFRGRTSTVEPLLRWRGLLAATS